MPVALADHIAHPGAEVVEALQPQSAPSQAMLSRSRLLSNDAPKDGICQASVAAAQRMLLMAINRQM